MKRGRVRIAYTHTYTQLFRLLTQIRRRGFAAFVWVSSSREPRACRVRERGCIAAAVYHTGVGIAGDDKPAIAQLIIGY